MKTAIVAAVVVLATASGCVSAAETARRYASAELRCPETRIRMDEVGPGAFRARGCGRRSYYLDMTGPSTVTVREPALVLTASERR